MPLHDVPTDPDKAAAAAYPWINSYVSGRYYAPPYLSQGNGDPGYVDGRMFVVAFPVFTRQAFDRIGTWLVAAYGAGTTARFGIFKAGPGMVAGALVVDGGTVAIDSGTLSWKEVTIAATLDPGIYFLAMAFQGGGSAGSGSLQRIAQSVYGTTGHSAGDATLQDANHGWYSSITGAFASNPTVTRGDLNAPLLKLRAA